MSLELIIGPMYAGKSTDVIRRTERHQLAGKRCIAIKHTDDTRWGAKTIQTHRGDRVSSDIICISVDKLVDADIVDYDVIAVDELQLFQDAVLTHTWANNGKIVICAALSANTRGELMGAMKDVIPLVDNIYKLLAVCKCGADAPYTRTLPGIVLPTNGVMLGGKNLYVAVCRLCAKDY